MSEMKDGGPAFPRGPVRIEHHGNVEFVGSEGMSLRDYFAAQALSGMLSQPADAANVLAYDRIDQAAAWAYAFADAMLAAREAK